MIQSSVYPDPPDDENVVPPLPPLSMDEEAIDEAVL